MASSKSPLLFYGAILIAVVAVALCVYYLTPGVYHVLTSGDPNAPHLKHAIGMGAIAVLAIVGALVTRPKSRAAVR